MPFALNGLKWAVPTVQWSFADLDLQGDPFQSTVTSSALRTAVRSAFAAWDAVTELDFLEVADSASSNIRIGEWALIANDTDPNGDIIDVTSVGGADSGSASHSPGSGTGGAITFTDGGAASGGTFTYVATDGSAAVGPSATVEVVNITGTTLIGRSGALRDIIIGGGTADFIDGLDGNDVLVGNGGNDTLNGGAGQDVMDGGAGFDTYAFDDGHSGSNAANADVIAGFVSGTDKIGLAAIDAITQAGNKGDQDFLWGGENSNVVANSVTWWKDTANNRTIVQMDTGGDSLEDAHGSCRADPVRMQENHDLPHRLSHPCREGRVRVALAVRCPV